MYLPAIADAWTVSHIQDKAAFMRFIMGMVPDKSVWVVGLDFSKAAAAELRPLAMPSPQPLWQRIAPAVFGGGGYLYVPLVPRTRPAILGLLSRGVCETLLVQHIYNGAVRDNDAYWLVSYDFLDDTRVSKRVPQSAMAEAAERCGFCYQ